MLFRFYVMFIIFNIECVCLDMTTRCKAPEQAEAAEASEAVVTEKDTEVTSLKELAANEAVNTTANAKRGEAEMVRQESEKAAYEESVRLAEEKAAEEAEAARLAEEAAKAQAEYNAIANQPENVPYTTTGCRADAFSYEHASAITSTESDQYKLVHSDAITVTDAGYLMRGDRYLVAVGTRYADHAGEDIDILYEDGTLLKATVGDFKSDRHTDPSHSFHYGWYDDDGVFHQGDGSVVEFLVGCDKPGNPPAAVRTGNKAVKVYPAPES